MPTGLLTSLPCATGEGDRRKAGEGAILQAELHAPSTMPRMVPLPRFTGEDDGPLAQGKSGNFHRFRSFICSKAASARVRAAL